MQQRDGGLSLRRGPTVAIYPSLVELSYLSYLSYLSIHRYGLRINDQRNTAARCLVSLCRLGDIDT
jgi:hypothetical protein